MIKQIFLTVLFASVFHAYGQQEISFEKAKLYIDGINGFLGNKQLYIRAEAYSYSVSDPVNPSDMVEFSIARKNSCTFVKLKEQESYINGDYSVQIDTMEKSIMVSDARNLPYSKIDINDLNFCESISMQQVKGSSYLMVFKLKPGNQYAQVEIMFDTTTQVLQKVMMEFQVTSNSIKEKDTRKIEIFYRQVQTSIPGHMNTCLAGDIIKVGRKREVEIKSKQYINYTIINLLEL